MLLHEKCFFSNHHAESQDITKTFSFNAKFNFVIQEGTWSTE